MALLLLGKGEEGEGQRGIPPSRNHHSMTLTCKCEGSFHNWDADRVTLEEVIYPEFAVIIHGTNKQKKEASSQAFEGFSF